MLIELLSELLNGFSPIYLYLGFLLSVIPLGLIQIGDQNRLFKNDIFIRRAHAIQFKLLPLMDLNAAIIDIRNWIANKTKRIEIPDDDNEEPSFSIFYSNKNRGGQKWKQLLYSLKLENIA